MITENIVGFDTRGGSTFVQGVEASIQTYLAEKFTIADQSTIDEALDKAVMAFEIYRHWSPDQRASFLNKISEIGRAHV